MNNETNTPIETTKKASRSAGAKRRLRYRASFAATVAIATAVVILFNVLIGVVADRYPLTLDISADKTFSLSDQSIQIAEQVQDDIQIIIFDDRDAIENPQSTNENYNNVLREFSIALKQFNAHSGGKITYTYINPNQEPAKMAAYTQYEVAQYNILFLCGERHRTITFDDLCTLDTSSYSYTGTYDVTESLVERALASNIYTLNGGEEHIVQVLTGHSEDSYVVSGLQKLYELNGYTFEEMPITTSAAFNDNAQTLLIAAPEQDYSDAEIKRIQDWLYNNGSYNRQLLVFVHPTADCPNLYEYLEVEYKVTVTNELILETDTNRMQGFNQYYPMADVDTTDFTTNAAGTNKVFTPLTRRLTTTLPTSIDKGSLGHYAVPLTQYPASAKLTKLSDLSSATATDDKSYKADEAAYPLTGMIVSCLNSYNNELGQDANSRVLVSGCAGATYADYVQNSSLNNEELFADALNTMTGIENAITISGKTLSNETVTFSNATALILGLGVFTVALPLALLVVCLVVFIRRKNL